MCYIDQYKFEPNTIILNPNSQIYVGFVSCLLIMSKFSSPRLQHVNDGLLRIWNKEGLIKELASIPLEDMEILLFVTFSRGAGVCVSISIMYIDNIMHNI